MPPRRTTDLQIRGVPVALRDRLRARATRKGVSMSQYVVERLEEDLALPTVDEWLDEVAKLPKVPLRARGIDTTKLLHDLDEERTEEVLRRTRSYPTRRRSSTSS